MHLQAAPAIAQPAADEATSYALPLTDVSPSSLIDVTTPLDKQEEVQHTLETEQQHAAVYSPGPDAIPQQTPDQVAAISGSSGSTAQSKTPAMLQLLSKHPKRDKQQLPSSKSGKATAVKRSWHLQAAFTAACPSLSSCSFCTAYVHYVGMLL